MSEMKIDPEQLCTFLWDLRKFAVSYSLNRSTRATEIIKYTTIILSIIAVVVGLIGNTLVIAIAGFRRKRMKVGIWILNLAIADFIFLWCLLPMVIYLYLESWPFGVYMCKCFMFFSSVNMHVSIFILTALTIDRCISVVNPIWHHQYMSRHLSLYICLVLWALTGILSIPVLLHGHVENVGNMSLCLLNLNLKNPFNTSNIFPVFSKSMATQTLEAFPDHTVSIELVRANVKEMVQIIHRNNSERIEIQRQDCMEKDVQKLIEAKVTNKEIDDWNEMVFSIEFISIPLIMVGYFIPLVIIISANIIMGLHVKQSKFMKSAKSSNVYKIIVAAVLAYFFTWTPLTVVLIMHMVAIHKMNLTLVYNLYNVLSLVTIIAYFHSCLNPILYVLVGQNVRREFRKFWYRSLSMKPQSQ